MKEKSQFKRSSATDYTHTRTHRVAQQALVRMPAFSTLIMGLYTTVMHSSLWLALFQTERQGGKGTGCHNLASTVDKSHSCRHTRTHTQSRPEHPFLNQPTVKACIQTNSTYLLVFTKHRKHNNTSLSAIWHHNCCTQNRHRCVGCDHAAPVCDKDKK